MDFNENMIGKRVREIATGDEGYITGPSCSSNRAYVDWITGREKGLNLNIDIEGIEFIEELSNTFEPQEITINGIRYFLTRIKD